MSCKEILITAVLLSGVQACALNEPVHTFGTDADATLPYWQVSADGFELRLVQRLPVQTRGYFLARGFSNKHADRVAQSCVFQTIIRNTSLQHDNSSTLEYRLSDWAVITDKTSSQLKLRENWQQEWLREKINKPAQIAFEWSLMPSTQQYLAGDYGWGMTTMNLKHGSYFDLRVCWVQHGEKYSTIIKNIQCAEDINPQPEGSM